MRNIGTMMKNYLGALTLNLYLSVIYLTSLSSDFLTIKKRGNASFCYEDSINPQKNLIQFLTHSRYSINANSYYHSCHWHHSYVIIPALAILNDWHYWLIINCDLSHSLL